jgi:hypothetical protein
VVPAGVRDHLLDEVGTDHQHALQDTDAAAPQPVSVVTQPAS